MRIRRQKNSGFTLLELLLVMAILVVLASLSTIAIFSLQRSSLQKSALVEIKTLKDACKMFRLNVGSYPTQLEDLSMAPNGLTKNQWGGPYLEKPINSDPWSRPYTYIANELDDRVDITSNGPDGQAGTEDDVPDPITN